MEKDDFAIEPESNSVLIESGRTSGDRHKSRRILAQICASFAQSLLMLDLGMMISVPTVVIGALHNVEGGLSLNDSQSSWFGSIMLLCQPLGSVLSGCAQGALGRKLSMLLVNIPHLVAWYLLYSAESVTTLYVASFTMGIGIGFLEAPTLAYIGEISEPRYRGILATCANSNIVIGHLLEYCFGYMFPWRRSMLISCSVPIIAVVAISLVPESPVWLLTRGRKDEAMVALRWLRGWVTADEVADEFHDLELYCLTSKHEYRKTWVAKNKKSSEFSEVPNSDFPERCVPYFLDRVKDLLRPGILIPLRLVTVYFFFYHAASMTAMRPYMIGIFNQLKVPLSPNLLTILSATLQGAGALTCISLVHYVGKRRLSLASMAGCALCCLSLGAYVFMTSHWYSPMPEIPLFLFCALYYCTNLGISSIPWLLVSEVFPTRGRGVAGGVSAATYYVIAFLVTKTWLNLQDLVQLHGCFFLYGFLGGLGVLFIYHCLPETEGKTLAEIEKRFASKR